MNDRGVMTTLGADQAMREVLEPLVRPVLADWHVDDGGALRDFLVALFRTGYNYEAVYDIVRQIESQPR
jgi:hypothetical protein